MKTPEDIINRFINEENVKFNQERDDWVIEAMEEYAKLYHESKVKKLNIPVVRLSLPSTKELREAREAYNKRAIAGHFDGDEPWKHFHAGVEWMLSRIVNGNET